MSRISRRTGVAALALILLAAPAFLHAAPSNDAAASPWGSAFFTAFEAWVDAAWSSLEGLVPIGGSPDGETGGPATESDPPPPPPPPAGGGGDDQERPIDLDPDG